MDANELRNLQEAYLEVYENQQLDEELTGERLKRAGTKMKSLGRRKSTLPSREALSRVSIGKEGTGVQGGKKAPVKRGGGGTAGRAKVSGTGGDDMDRGYGNKAKRRAAELNKEEVSIYDIVLSHLLDEGYAKTVKQAEGIMLNMSEEWKQSIVEEVISEGRRTSLSALSRESQSRKADKERGRPETQDEKHRRLAMGRYSPSQYKWKKVDGQWKSMGRKDGEKD